MKNNSTLFTIFLIVFVDLLGFGIVLPLLPYIAEQYEASPFTIGLLGGTYSLFQLISGPILGRLSDRYGRRKLLAISQFGSAVGFGLLGFANALPLIFISRIIDGITGGNISIAQAYIADITTRENRAKGMGILGAAFGLGFVFGPAIGGFLARFGYAYPAYFAMAIALLTVVLTLFTLPETVKTEDTQKSPKTKLTLTDFVSVVRSPHIGYLVVSFLLLNSAFSILHGTFALWTERKFGFGPEQNGYIFAFIGIIAVIAQLKLLPFLVKRFHEKKLLNYSTLFFAAGFFLLPAIPNPWFLMVTQTLIVIGNSMANPSIQALASEHVAKEKYGETMGILQSAGSLGRIVGPVLGGYLFGAFGIDSPFYVAAGVIGIMGLYLFYKRE